MNKIVNLGSVKQSCTGCGLAKSCIPADLKPEQLDKFSKYIKHNRSLTKNQTLFEQHQPFKSLYMVCTGLLKSYIATNDGYEQVIHFHMPGELVGLDALGHHIHTCTAVALESTTFCEIPYKALHDMYGHVTSLSDHFMGVMSNEIAEEHEMLLLLGRKSAEARVAVFLLSMSSRFRIRGFSPSEFNLNITRTDMANYLGLAVETISRVLSHLHKDKIVKINRREFCIVDFVKLRELADIDETEIISMRLGKQLD